jgi:hypothetical protein
MLARKEIQKVTIMSTIPRGWAVRFFNGKARAVAVAVRLDGKEPPRTCPLEELPKEFEDWAILGGTKSEI